MINLAVVAKSEPGRIGTFGRERGWHNLRLLSSRGNDYNRDYHAESAEGEQIPILNVFVRDGEQLRHAWATELMFAPREEGMEARHADAIWPLWNVLDLTPGGARNAAGLSKSGRPVAATVRTAATRAPPARRACAAAPQSGAVPLRAR